MPVKYSMWRFRKYVFGVSLFGNFCVLAYVSLHAPNTSDNENAVQLPARKVNYAPLQASLRHINVALVDSVSESLPAPLLSSLMPLPNNYNNAEVTVKQNIPEPIWPAMGKSAAAKISAVKLPLPCRNKERTFSYGQRGNFWVLNNYILSEKDYSCEETVTYTTHGNVNFFDNLVPLSQRWPGPLSMAVYVPGTDYKTAINSIAYLRQCTGPDVKERITFHFVFDAQHFPGALLKMHPLQQPNGELNKTQESNPSASKLGKGMQFQVTNGKAVLRMDTTTTVSDKAAPLPSTGDGLPIVNCSGPAPWSTPPQPTYKDQKKLTYPVNILRNVARQAAPTHYVLASDAELYPSPRLPQLFMDMLRENVSLVTDGQHKVFVLPIFEVYGNQTVPDSKEQLVSMLASKLAIPFHQFVCPQCHSIPKANEWKAQPITPGMHVFHKAKRHKPYDHWEPIYIGTQDDPLYDERLTWEGRSDKMTQGYALCVLDYDFLILDNAFLTHKPGVKLHKKDKTRDTLTAKQSSLIRSTISKELKVLYGSNPKCNI